MRRKNKVMAFGTFDLLHKGHIFYLRKASRFGRLIVIVARDENVKKFKGVKPIDSEQVRLKNVRLLRFVSCAVLGSLNDRYKTVKYTKPEVICLGYDQKISVLKLKKELKKRDVKTRVIRLKAYKPRIYKSSKLKQQYINKGRNFYKSLNHR